MTLFLLLVGLGTSCPELTTSIVAAVVLVLSSTLLFTKL